ncbi:MAG: hypothetical protein ACJAVM_000129 [Sulfitobacter sp.]|jgi:hypothetical protein
MRRVLWSDVQAAARAVLAVDSPARAAFCGALLRQAAAADRYTRRLKRDHPHWGNGTLLAAARHYPLADERSFDDPDYCACCLIVMGQIQQHRQKILVSQAFTPT